MQSVIQSLAAPLLHRRGDPLLPADGVGGKAHNLARLVDAGAAMPPWIALPAATFDRLVGELGPWPATAEEAVQRQAAVRALPLPEPLRAGVQAALRGAGLEDRLLAVRSSGVGEDASERSFAGQFDSVLGVRGEEIWDAIRQVWASAFNPHALHYGGGGVRMGVVIQAMVDPAVSGVAFGADPVTGERDVAVISAVYGLGEGLVSGALDADTFRVGSDEGGTAAIERTTAHKTRAVRLAPDGGTRTESVPPELQDRPALSDAEAREIAAFVRRLGERFGPPQDVEWAREAGADGRLLILQTRPITTLPAAPSAGERRVWDNSNIVESYAGITAPLTFSFARGVYEQVYRQFCTLVGVDGETLDRNRHVFANMLGLVRGRVYYNLLNWYRVLALLPGFALNRDFMERMMGVREKLEHAPISQPTSDRGRDALRVLRMVGRLMQESRGLRAAVPAFHAHVDAILAPLADEDFTTWPADRLAELYRRLEEELLRRWQTPIVNDFFAMIWFGLLGRLVEGWLPDEPPTFINDLLVHEGGIISTEPVRRVAEMAQLVRSTPAVAEHFAEEPDDERLWQQLAENPACSAFSREIQTYLSRFGDRCMNELKLETRTLRDDPGLLLQTIRGYLEAGVGSADSAPDAQVRPAAEQRVREHLGAVRRRVFALVLAQARARVRDRENLRFERTRVFGLVRRIVLGLGHHLDRAGLLDEPRDIFFLTIEEVLGHVDGTASTSELGGLVALRRAEWERYAREPAPPDRFESIGPVGLGHWIVPPSTAEGDGTTLQGLGCCPGVIRAPVRIVRDPRDARDLGGHILVAERTDPGWTLLFPAAVGLLVERGSLLSHSAIVAREVGLPCVVAVRGLLTTLRDGERVEMDGTTGTIRRLDA